MEWCVVTPHVDQATCYLLLLKCNQKAYFTFPRFDRANAELVASGHALLQRYRWAFCGDIRMAKLHASSGEAGKRCRYPRTAVVVVS